MKKHLLTFAILFFTSVILFAQTYCGTSRYDTVVFSAVTTASNVVYGFNTTNSGAGDTLKMDIYQPTGDVAVKRPLIVFAHGGSFIGGSKTDSYAIDFCTRFAKRGYVAVSIDYRLGMSFPFNQANGQKAVWRATQDMKAAVRFFRKDAATANTYKIDPDYIFGAGYSAGAFMAVQYAYLDRSSEVPSGIDTVALGGLEGNSGNPGYCSRINAVVNLAGAVGDTSWIQPGDEPMITAQGDADGTVPYCTAMIYVSGFAIMPVSGGGTMNVRAYHIGLTNPIHTYYAQDHDADVNATNMDSTTILVSDFLYRQLGCNMTGGVRYTNHQTCVPGSGIDNVMALFTNDPCPNSGVNEWVLNSENVSLFPNPASENVTVTLKDVQGRNFSVELSDISGRIVRQFSVSGDGFTVQRKNLEDGIYFMRLTSNKNESFAAKILFAK